MDTRRAIKNKDGIYVNIPIDIVRALEIKPRERLKVSYVSGMGVFITQQRGADRVPTLPRSIEGLQKAADSICSQTETKLKEIASTSIKNYFTSMIEQFSRLGIFELQKRVERMEKREQDNIWGKGNLALIRERKRMRG